MDMISLMPQDTYKGTAIRKDIGEMLEALEPTFLRFPGGCVIEGRDEESMYSWKDSIGNGATLTVDGVTTTGDEAVRPQGRSIWQGTAGHPFYTTYGIEPSKWNYPLTLHINHGRRVIISFTDNHPIFVYNMSVIIFNRYYHLTQGI